MISIVIGRWPNKLKLKLVLHPVASRRTAHFPFHIPPCTRLSVGYPALSSLVMTDHGLKMVIRH